MTSPSAPQPTTQTECSQPPAARTFPVHHHPTSSAPDPQLRLETLLVRSGTGTDPATGAITTPIHLSTAYGHPGLGESTGYDYTRTASPTRDVLQDALARLEGGTAAFALSSGMAALELVTRTLAPHGSRIVALRDLYGGSFRFLEVLAEEGAADVDFVLGLEGLRGALAGPADLVIIETPTNPMMEEISIPEAAELAHAAGAKLVVDNTFATPVLQRPLELGADVVVHSTTKYVGGHSDVIGGAFILRDGLELPAHVEPFFGERDAAAEAVKLQMALGHVPSPRDTYLAHRGLKTLALRVERHCENAQRIAEFLASHPKVSAVHYPGLASDPGYELAQRQNPRGIGGVLSFQVATEEGAPVTTAPPRCGRSSTPMPAPPSRPAPSPSS